MVQAPTILGPAFRSLVDQHYIVLIKVETQQTQAAHFMSTNTVQKLKGLKDKAIICFVVLIPPEVLKAKENTT